jgi:hypothetical protein
LEYAGQDLSKFVDPGGDVTTVGRHNDATMMLDWRIAKIGVDEHDTTMMLDWLSEIERRKKRIPSKLSVLRKMLIRNPSDRITAPELVSDLRTTPQIKALTAELCN